MADRSALSNDAIAFLNHFMLQGGTAADVPGPPARALGFMCPKSAPSTGPFDAASWPELADGQITFSGPAPQTVDAEGGRSDLEWATDPTPIEKDVGLPWPGPATRDDEVPGELAAELWDVDEAEGRQSLVTKGIYRLEPDQAGTVTFQLNGSAWAFNPGTMPT